MAPKTNSTAVKVDTMATPAARKMPRKSRAPMTPKNNTRCWYSRGTLKYPKMSAKTNRLSTDSDFSSSQAVVNSTAGSLPMVAQMTPANASEMPTQTPLQIAASLNLMMCAPRWASRSTVSMIRTTAPKAAQAQKGTVMSAPEWLYG